MVGFSWVVMSKQKPGLLPALCFRLFSACSEFRRSSIPATPFLCSRMFRISLCSFFVPLHLFDTSTFFNH